MNPLTALPAKVRKSIYAFYATLGIAFGAVQVGFATANADQPLWLLVAFGVFGYLGTALGLVAASNVTSTDTAKYSKALEASSASLAEARRSMARQDKTLTQVNAKLADIAASAARRNTGK